MVVGDKATEDDHKIAEMAAFDRDIIDKWPTSKHRNRCARQAECDFDGQPLEISLFSQEPPG